MHPSHAEIARTLAAGALPADTHIACRPGPFPVRHVTDPEGRVLVLAPTGGASAAALRPTPGNDDVAVVLEVTDLPPIAGAPSLGRVWVAGWATALSGDAARAAAVAYADVDPAPDLLDVGRGQTLHRVEVAEVRLEHDGVTIDVDPDEYAAAQPDPLHPAEFDLLADLTDHHGAEVSGYVRRTLGVGDEAEPRVVRLDRYGLVVRLGARLTRLDFPHPVRSRADLADLLHPVLCRRCAPA
jgi:hypothetical protein